MTKKRTYDDKLHIDMPFGEALERFIGVDPKQMEANIAKSKKKKPPTGRKVPPPAGDRGHEKTENVVSLRDRRSRRRNGN